MKKSLVNIGTFTLDKKAINQFKLTPLKKDLVISSSKKLAIEVGRPLLKRCCRPEAKAHVARAMLQVILNVRQESPGTSSTSQFHNKKHSNKI